MRHLSSFFFFVSILTQAFANHSHEILNGHDQLIVVTTRDWEEKQGDLRLYERAHSDAPWVSVGSLIPVVLGKAGLAWGIGLHPEAMLPRKAEKDYKSPAGIFSLGSAFGFAPHMYDLKIEYLSLDEWIEAVDDPQSFYYNTIVNRKAVIPDWQSSEKMREIPLYELGFVVNHNFPNPQKSSGSAIFFHIWQEQDVGTAGCTAMSQDHLISILSWLDRSKNPVLVQLPVAEYDVLRDHWHLPTLILCKN